MYPTNYVVEPDNFEQSLLTARYFVILDLVIDEPYR